MSIRASCFLSLSLLALCVTESRAGTVVNSGAVGIVRGPSSLDLTGDIVYAVNFSANDPDLVVGGVTFVPDTNPPVGTSFVLPNTVSPWQVKPEFGSSADDDALEQIYEDIRWANAGAAQQLEAHLPVTAGQTYKLQLLIYENKSGNRRWDIQVEGAISVDEFTSQGISAPGTRLRPYENNAGVVFTEVITAADDTLSVIMGNLGGGLDAADRNALWQGLTLERVVVGPDDSDGDGLPDAWEMAKFGNLAQTYHGDQDSDTLGNGAELVMDTNPAAADSDGDGLQDAAEAFTHGTSTTVVDSDGDGLNDGAEVNVHSTDPLATDSDADGLSDSAEVNTHGTNPLSRDTDGDDYSDPAELANGTNPSNPASFPLLSTQIQRFSGGDAGEGLDLTGTFTSAIRFGASTLDGSWAVRGATFVPYHSVAALTHNSVFDAANWTTMNFPGTLTADDTNLAAVMKSIRYVGGSFNIALTGLTVGKPYKLQLLFAEQCCVNRGFDIYVEDVLVADEFSPPAVHGGASGTPVNGAVVIHGFLATDTTMNIRLDKSTVTTPGLNDPNPILNAMTLEEMTGADADADGLDDLWEVANFGSLSSTATQDADSDGLSNLAEFNAGTNPNDSDTDNDTLTDGAEVNTHATNPKLADTDGDGLSDAHELNTSLTNPNSADTDGDGYSDSLEIARGTSPTNAAIYPLFGTLAGGFTGGDPGEGLDLTGTFLYGFNVGTPGAAPGPVGGVTFGADSDPGITIAAPNQIPDWHAPEYGSSANDDNLEFVMQSIRWANGPATVNVDLDGLTPGQIYKLQLLVAEQCCDNRAYDVEVEGALALDEFNTAFHQGGPGKTDRGSVISLVFVAPDSALNIVLNGNTVSTPGWIDVNPILSALTLESISLPDTDGDGLADVWELQFLGNLAAGAAADPDADGLSNLLEFQGSTHPGRADTDADGLADNVELGLGTHPLHPDSDRDGLTDGYERNTSLTDPLVADTDADGWNDSAEAGLGFDPLSNLSVPVSEATVFIGGDAGEGLDLDGTFLYAFNVGTNGAGVQARDALFSADNAPGITVTAQNEIPAWVGPDYGATPNDDAVEQVMRSIRWTNSPGTVDVTLANIVVGQRYKVQLLFADNGGDRGFDVSMEGVKVQSDFHPGRVHGGPGTEGAVVTVEFIARDTELNISLRGSLPSSDKNPILNALTLEALPAVAPAGASLSVVSISAAGVSFTAVGTPGKVYALDYSTDLLTGTWSEVDDNVLMSAGGAASPIDTVPAHRTPGRGYWRLRDPVLKPAP